MSESEKRTYHSLEKMRALKDAALPTHGENRDEPGELSRRRMLQLMAGTSAALMLTGQGCERKPRRKIVSRVDGPEYQRPGEALYYSSTWTEGPRPYGLIIKTVDGRPVKIDGSPDHPVNRGVSDAAMQASILSLYDPDRLQAPEAGGSKISWEAADGRIVQALREARSVALFTRSTIGPAEQEMVGTFLEQFSRGHHFVHEAADDMPRRRAWRKVYGSGGEPVPRFDKAKVILSLDSDFLSTDGPVMENIRTFAEGRSLDDSRHAEADPVRLYVVESVMTLTGSNADHRIRLRPSAIAGVAEALSAALGGDETTPDALADRYRLDRAVLTALVHDLASNRGHSLVVAGPHLPERVHAAVALLNDRLEAPGNTLEWNPVPPSLPVSDRSEVKAAFEAGVDVAIFLGVNPVYDWPGGGFGEMLGKARLTVGHGMYDDETVSACSLSLAGSHYLESWNDRPVRHGAESLCQPVIAPLFDTRQEAESLLRWTQALSEENDPVRNLKDWHDFLRRRWQRRLAATGSSDDGAVRRRAWEETLRIGGRMNTGSAAFPALGRAAAGSYKAEGEAEAGEFELVIHPHHAIHDGRFANNGWLQEFPDPVSKMVWGNAAAISPATAAKLGVPEGSMLEVGAGGRSIRIPALVQPGAADGVVALTLGHGRTAGGMVAREAGGANASVLLGAEGDGTPRLVLNAQIAKGAGTSAIVRTQKQFSMHDRPIALDGSLEMYRREPDFVKHLRHLPDQADLYEPYDYSEGHKWAMSIDLNACIGCGGCMVACQAENNIPIVGREECDLGREMHWMRIDRYLEGDPDNPTVHHQPMLCQHCDNAPCENVCPVNATSHSPEGLNEMTYNRCVGTRYCANNCPYKVRRYNFFRYQEAQLRDPLQELMFNPQVTVRGIGVMEKCTFCVQRINAAKFEARNAGTTPAVGAVRTACQEACPAQAISFGDVNDPGSAITAERSSPRAYHLLEELNIKPNVTYLARVRNPNPDTGGASDEPAGEHEA